MKTIKKLILENFQSHKYSSLEFDQGLNAIVGPTDSGKTAIFRAIKWALYNEPQGDYFIREGESSVSVKVVFSDGVEIHRYRSKSKNGYEITYSDGSVSSFEGFGTKVPKEVYEATKMPKINLTQSENRSLNMAEQLDGPFLLGDSSSLKAAAIGKLVEADVLDYALSEVNIDLKNKKKDLKNISEEVTNIKEDLKNYIYLDDLKTTITKLEAIKEKIENKEEELKKLENIFSKYKLILENKTQLENNLKLLEKTRDSELIAYKTENLLRQKNKLEALKLEAENNNKRIKYTENILNKLVNIKESSDNYQKAQNQYNYLSKLSNINKGYRSLTSRKNTILQDIKTFENLTKLDNNKNVLEEKIRKYTYFQRAQANMTILKERIKNGNNYIEKFSNIKGAEERLKASQSLANKNAALANILIKRNQLQEKIKKEESNMEKESLLINKLKAEYKEIIATLKVCPTCNRPFTNHDMDTILEHLGK